jgi:hypothetical protein
VKSSAEPGRQPRHPLGRKATSRGVIDAVGRKGRVTVEVGEYGY